MEPRRVALSVLAFILWAATAALGLWEIVVIREMLLRVYARFWSDYWSAAALRNWTVLVLGLVWIVVVIGGGEYHYRRLGQRRSWRLFGWTIAGELAILVLAYSV